jgi:hypothetical protein
MMAGRPMTIDVPTAAALSEAGQPVFRVWDSNGEVIVEAAMLSALCGKSLQPQSLLSAFVEGQVAWKQEARSVEVVSLLAPAGVVLEPPFGEGSAAQLYHGLKLLDESHCIASGAFAGIWSAAAARDGPHEQLIEQGLAYMCSQVDRDPTATANMRQASSAISNLLTTLGPVLMAAFVAEIMELSSGATAAPRTGRSRSATQGLAIKSVLSRAGTWLDKAREAERRAAVIEADAQAATALRDLQVGGTGNALGGAGAFVTPSLGAGAGGADTPGGMPPPPGRMISATAPGLQGYGVTGDGVAATPLAKQLATLLAGSTPQGDVAALRRELSTLTAQVQALMQAKGPGTGGGLARLGGAGGGPERAVPSHPDGVPPGLRL